jgi:hypothetical protein
MARDLLIVNCLQKYQTDHAKSALRACGKINVMRTVNLDRWYGFVCETIYLFGLWLGEDAAELMEKLFAMNHLFHVFWIRAQPQMSTDHEFALNVQECKTTVSRASAFVR